MFLRRRKSRGEASYFRRLCAKFVLKICTMDRILQNQWNVQNHLKPLFAKKKRGNIREIKPLTLLDFFDLSRRGPGSSPSRLTT